MRKTDPLLKLLRRLEKLEQEKKDQKKQYLVAIQDIEDEKTELRKEIHKHAGSSLVSHLETNWDD